MGRLPLKEKKYLKCSECPETFTPRFPWQQTCSRPCSYKRALRKVNERNIKKRKEVSLAGEVIFTGSKHFVKKIGMRFHK